MIRRALVVVLTLAGLALASNLGDVDLRLGGGSSAAPAASADAAPASGEPRWVTAPLRPPSPVAP